MDQPLRGPDINALNAAFHGSILRPGEAAYEQARHIWNGMIDRHPALIGQCVDAEDVRTLVEFAHRHHLEVGVRGGGHGIDGYAMVDGGLVIDLSHMQQVKLDPVNTTANAQGGVTWGVYDKATQTAKLASTGAAVSTTGIAGLTLGGGFGWLMRKYGLACDNLLSAEVVLADGRLVHTDSTSHPELFWALRGGGGNFGIVTTFTYRLHPVPSVLGGMVFYPVAQASTVLHAYREFVTSAPDELTSAVVFITAPPFPGVPADVQGQPTIVILLCYAGPTAEGERVVQPLRTIVPPLVDLIREMPYTAIQSMLDAAAPPGLQNYWKSAYLNELSDAAIAELISQSAGLTSPVSHVQILHLRGAVSRVGEEETAFSHRNVQFILEIVSTWPSPAENERHIRWTRQMAEAMEPYSTGGVYVNYLGAGEEDQVVAAYGPEKYQRLAVVKSQYDPANFFHRNQNIVPQRM